MSEILLRYQQVHPTTWAYLSSLLMLALYFKFNRFWSVRNLDLLLLILLAPGLLLYYNGKEVERTAAHRYLSQEEAGKKAAAEKAELAAPGVAAPTSTPEATPVTPPSATANETPSLAAAPAGPSPETPEPAKSTTAQFQAELDRGRSIEAAGFLWLLSVCGVLLVRMLVDATMVRRPLLEPNLTTGGLIFLGVALFVFLMANVIASTPSEDDLQGPRSAMKLVTREAAGPEEQSLNRHGPGYALLFMLPTVPTMGLSEPTDLAAEQYSLVVAAKTTAILAHLALAIAVVLVGYWHFDNIKMGVGAATLYLLLPYTALMTGHPDHALLGALITWAVALYRRPLLAGIFLGLAMGAFYYPLFLLPLWLSFYWERGLTRFLTGSLATLGVLVCSLLFTSSNMADFWGQFQQMFGLWSPLVENLQGVWGLAWSPWYRYPVLAAFTALSVTMALWPPQKNLGTLLSCTAAIMLAVQFWHGFGGGLYMAWFLPLVLLTVFRPNLEDRVALSVLTEGWFTRRSETNRSAKAA